jgi:AraC-like DNA-binding protein
MQPDGNNKKIPAFTLSEANGGGNVLFVVKKLCGDGIGLKEQMYLPHRKDYYFFFLAKKGSSRHWVDFLGYQVQPHHLYFTLPHQVHVKEKGDPANGLLMLLSEEFLTLCNDETLKQLPVLQNKALKHALHLLAGEEAFLDNLFEQIIAEYALARAHMQTMLQSYVKIFLAHLSRVYTRQFSDTDNGVKQKALFIAFSKLLDEKYMQLHHASGYASALHVTAGHLNSAVQHEMGKTVTGMIQERIMMEAKRLLFHSDMSVKEIGYSLGFDDAAYFNRVFKREAGVTPLEFRQQNHGKYN